MNFDEFKDQYQKVPVEEYPNQTPENPVVSVCVQTYQHAPYIRECLDSILMQETDFPFEILLGEDESTDGTREICIEYAQKYPDKIRLFLHHRENNIQILGSPTGRFNSLTNFYSAKGKYIAICEGDDYWTDPKKLQKQVSFLQSNSNISANFTNGLVKNELTNRIYDYHKQPMKDIINIEDIILAGGSIYPTCSLVFKINIISLPTFVELTNHLSGDTALIYLLAHAGKVTYLNEKTCVYRRWSGGIYSGIIDDKQKICNHKKNIIPGLIQFDKLTNKIYHRYLSKKISHESLYILRHGKMGDHLKYLKYLSAKDFLRLIKSSVRRA